MLGKEKQFERSAYHIFQNIRVIEVYVLAFFQLSDLNPSKKKMLVFMSFFFNT